MQEDIKILSSARTKVFFDQPLTEEENTAAYNAIITIHRHDFNITDLESLDRFLNRCYEQENYADIGIVLKDLLYFYKEESDDKITSILDFIIEKGIDKEPHVKTEEKHRLFRSELLESASQFIKKDIIYNFNKILHILKSINTDPKDFLYRLIRSFKRDYKRELFIEMMRAFDMRLLFSHMRPPHEVWENSRYIDLDVDLPLYLPYTLDDLVVIYNLNKEHITPLQLSLITGLHIQDIMKDYEIMFKHFSNIILDMLDENIPFENGKYKLSKEKYKEIYMMEKENYRHNAFKDRENRSNYIQYYIIKEKDIEHYGEYVDEKEKFKKLVDTKYKDLYDTDSEHKYEHKSQEDWFKPEEVDLTNKQKLQSLTVKDLRKIASYHKRTGYSSLKKDELIKFLMKK